MIAENGKDSIAIDDGFCSIAIILCTFNGERYLGKQLESIISQKYTKWTIFISDDGSTDTTLEIIKQYQEKLGTDKIILLSGPKKGFAWNFLSALKKASPNYNYYAFCDQDDIWLPDKLSRGVSKLEQENAEIPMIHCGRTILINDNEEQYGMSYLFSRKPSFKNALMQNIAGGNTMLLNRSAQKLVTETPDDKEIISHDWWVYIVVTGCGGKVVYDSEPMLLYRQHSGNIIGSNTSLFSKISRLRRFLSGEFRTWSDRNLNALCFFKAKLTKENQEIVDVFTRARNANLILRIVLFSRIGLYRQTLSGTLALVLGVILKKL